MVHRMFDNVASVREYFRELLNKDNTYKFPYQFTIHYYGRDNKYNEATIVSVVRNSEASRPRLLAIDGTKVELSYCVVKELTEQALGIYRYLSSAKEELKRNNLLEALKPYEGKDYDKWFKDNGFVKVNFSSDYLEKIKEGTYHADSLEKLSSVYYTAGAVKSFIEKYNEVLAKFKSGDEENCYNLLTSKEKSWYHYFRKMKGFDLEFEQQMHDLWKDADDFNVELPVFCSVSYSPSLADKLKDYSKYLYFVSSSTAALEQLQDLWNHGWKPYKTCDLYWRDIEFVSRAYKGFLLRYEG